MADFRIRRRSERTNSPAKAPDWTGRATCAVAEWVWLAWQPAHGADSSQRRRLGLTQTRFAEKVRSESGIDVEKPELTEANFDAHRALEPGDDATRRLGASPRDGASTQNRSPRSKSLTRKVYRMRQAGIDYSRGASDPWTPDELRSKRQTCVNRTLNGVFMSCQVLQLSVNARFGLASSPQVIRRLH